MRRHLPVIAIALFAACVSALDPARAADIECHSNRKYFVAVQTYDDDAGSGFAVTSLADRKKPGACRFDAGKADYTIGERADPLWYGELAGKFLILRRSTGPQGDLVVYDLDSRKPVLDVPADDFTLRRDQLAFWERTGQATEANCPGFAENQANGLGSVIAVRKIFDLGTSTIRPTEEMRCDATQ